MSRSSESVVKGVEQASDSTPLEPSGPPKTTLGETLRCEWKSRFGESTEKPLVSSQCATCHTMEPPSTARLLAPSLQPLVPFVPPPSFLGSVSSLFSFFFQFFLSLLLGTTLLALTRFGFAAGCPSLWSRQSQQSQHDEAHTVTQIAVRPTHSQQSLRSQ